MGRRRGWLLLVSVSLFVFVLASSALAFGTGQYDSRTDLVVSGFGSSARVTGWNYYNGSLNTMHTHCQIVPKQGTVANSKIRQCQVSFYSSQGVLQEAKARGQTSWTTGGTSLDSGSISSINSKCHGSGGGLRPNWYFFGLFDYSIQFFELNQVHQIDASMSIGPTTCGEVFAS